MPKAKLPFKKFSWTSQLAYAIGLIVTDGNLSKDGRHIIMRSAEIEQLENFKDCLKIENKIGTTYDHGKEKRPYYRVCVGSVQLYKWLLSIGITPAKTHTIGKIKIPRKYFRDFLRGHLDGDGYIQSYTDLYNKYKDKNYVNTRIYTRFISASKKHIRWLYEMIKEYAPIKKGAILKHKAYINRAPMWEARFSKYDSLKLLQWMYYEKTIPSLSRKRMIAENLLGRVVNNKLIR